MAERLYVRIDAKLNFGLASKAPPESGLGITKDAANGTFNASLLSEGNKRTAALAILLLHLLSSWGGVMAGLLHTVEPLFS